MIFFSKMASLLYKMAGRRNEGHAVNLVNYYVHY